MKKLMFVLCLFVFPLTLASDTQHRFKVYVYVSGKDDQAVKTVENYLKRELRLLGDVDVVGVQDNWEYIIDVYIMGLEMEDGRETGRYAIAYYNGMRLWKHLYSVHGDYERFSSIIGSSIKLGSAFYKKESLQEYCIITVGEFEKHKLVFARTLYK